MNLSIYSLLRKRYKKLYGLKFIAAHFFQYEGHFFKSCDNKAKASVLEESFLFDFEAEQILLNKDTPDFVILNMDDQPNVN
jgi:hypothetical protein